MILSIQKLHSNYVENVLWELSNKVLTKYIIVDSEQQSIMKQIVKYIFENYPIVSIEADTDIENIIVQKVLEKVGFLKEVR